MYESPIMCATQSNLIFSLIPQLAAAAVPHAWPGQGTSDAAVFPRAPPDQAWTSSRSSCRRRPVLPYILRHELDVVPSYTWRGVVPAKVSFAFPRFRSLRLPGGPPAAAAARVPHHQRSSPVPVLRYWMNLM